MRQRKKEKQLLAVALSALLAVGGLPTMAFADGGQKLGEHTQECYTDDLICGYIVDEENIASDSNAIASDSNAEHIHTQECYALDCPHECGEHKVNGELAKTITDWTFVGDDYLNEGELPLPGVSMDQQADFNTVVSMLPTGISAEIEGETETTQVDITRWNCPEYVQDADHNWPVTGEYVFTAELPEGYACDPLPTVKVLIGGAELYAGGTGAFTVSGDASGYEWKDPVLTIKNGADLTIQNTDPNTSTLHRIKVESGATAAITLNGVNIDVDSVNACAFDMTGATVTLTLADGANNRLKSGGDHAGLQVPEGAALTIQGDGELEAIGDEGAGIGGNAGDEDNGDNAGTVIIRDSAHVTATSHDGAGIGGGSDGGNAISSNNGGSGGIITIADNAVVTAESTMGAGIGGGSGGHSGNSGDGGSGGIITIAGNAVVTAMSTDGAGIGGGGGDNGGSGDEITIQDNVLVTAESRSGAGIGGGGGRTGYSGGDGGKITIEGNAVVFARTTGNHYPMPIGGGSGGDSSSVGDAGDITTTKGVIFELQLHGSTSNDHYTGWVYGDVTLPRDLTIPNGATLEIPDGSSLTVPEDVALTNNGEIKGEGELKGDGTFGGSGTFAQKADRTIPAPRVAGKTPTSVTLGVVTPTGDGTVEYAKSTGSAAPADGWQEGLTFSGLNPGETYYFFARVTGSAIYKDAVSTGQEVTMDIMTINIKDILGVTAPALGAVPVSVITETEQYTGAVVWSPALAEDGTFAADTAYTATITLTPKDAFTLQGVEENFFTVERATATNDANSGIITAAFPKTSAAPTYTMSADKGSLSFGSATVGYTAPPAQIVTITNTGNQSVTLIQPTATDYIVGTLSKTELAPNEEATFTVQPKNGLAKNTYSETVIVANTQGKRVSILLSFTVADKPAYPEVVNGGSGGDSSSNGSTDTAPKDSYTSTGNQISQAVSRSDLQRLADAGKSLTIQGGTATMAFDPAALKAILAAVPATAGNITFAAVPADISAFPEAAKLIGARPAYSFTFSYKDSKGNMIPVNVNFPAGSVFISLNYAPAEGEVTGSLFMVYVDGQGTMTWLNKSSYKVNSGEADREGALRHDNGRVLADAPHFSIYGVAYKTTAPVFGDITNHWAKEDIQFVAARGLISGMGTNSFSPDTAMTRGMFVTALGRLAGVNPDSYQTRSFTDVKADAYYAAYVEWAVQKNIVKGTGEGLFSPDAPVTREQMAVMMVNYAGQMGYSIPVPLAAVTFADSDKISAWAVKEVAAMQRAGIIKGKDRNRFDPQASATRAEVSAVLHRFVQTVIDPATTQRSHSDRHHD